VTARDSDGNNTGVGGDIFWAYVRNECEKSNGFKCYDAPNQVKVLDPEINGRMLDNQDGTYTYNFTTKREGRITVYVNLYTRFGVFVEWFKNTNLNGTVAAEKIEKQLNLDYGISDTPAGQSDSVSANIFFKLMSPVSLPVNFYFPVNDQSTVSFEGIEKGISTKTNTVSFSHDLDQNQIYDFQLNYIETTDAANVQMAWTYQGQALIPVPSQYLYYPEYVQNQVYQVNSVCGEGYHKDLPGSPNICTSMCNDGVVISPEECDDGNKNNGDGCSSTCTLEKGYK
jgi:cysteine-rich repeat protein